MGTLRWTLVFICLGAAAGCGDGPTTPPKPPDAPAISCPASLTLESPDNVPMPASFQLPTTTGGQSPVTISCTSQSGETFPLGSTTVQCTATDALQRTASCSFAISIAPTPRISKTAFLAFGDSITYGRCNNDPDTCDPYTVHLRSLLEARYTRQSFTIVTAGVRGENASNDIPPSNDNEAGQDRLLDELRDRAPEVLLLMEGTNDIINAPGGAEEGVELAAEALEQMVVAAKNRQVEVFLATIPPMRYPPPAGTTRDRSAHGPFVPMLNERIRQIAQRRNVTLVDVYAAMHADLAGTIGTDNLHPSAKGLQVIANTFYAAIRQRLDSTPADR